MPRGVKAALVAVFAVASVAASAQVPAPQGEAPALRFVSLAAAGAHGRHGPSLEHEIDWIYQRTGLPLQVTAESGPWRRVRDPGGDQVWMHVRNLDQRRTAYLLTEAPLRRAAREDAAPIAVLGAGVVAPLTGCEGDWRRLAVGGRVGWVKQDALWGAPDCAGV
jgi:SH3-like domain-containing protein